MREKRRSLEQAANWCGVLLRCIHAELYNEQGEPKERIQEQLHCMTTIAANLNRISKLEKANGRDQDREVFSDYVGG